MQGEFDPKRKTLEVARDIPQREKDLAVIDKMLEGSAIKLWVTTIMPKAVTVDGFSEKVAGNFL